MIFNSSDFLIFITVTMLVMAFTPQKWRIYLLLFASYIFYASWQPIYLLILIGSTVLDFYLAKKLIAQHNHRISKLGLITSIVMNLGVLFIFKYLDFFGEILVSMMNGSRPFEPFAFVLPIGISFYTFQTIGYSVDVYRRTIEPESRLVRFALYTSFFPQLVAGPIERAKDLLPQFSNKSIGLIRENVKVATWYFLMGFFMKVVLADNSGVVVDSIYENLQSASNEKQAYAAFLFTLQIYADFAGYSLMAIGLARLLNIKLTENFTYPFFTQSLTEFWRSWHRTLSFWFKDYLYIPLGGSQKGKLRTFVNLLVVFILVGFWHGAAWNFILWGLLNGTVLIIERVLNLRTNSKGFLGWFRTGVTFGITLLFFVSFRLDSLSDIIQVWESIFTISVRELAILIYDNRFSAPILGGLILFGLELRLYPKPTLQIKNWHWIAQMFLLLTLSVAIVLLGNFSGGPFIYFQF